MTASERDRAALRVASDLQDELDDLLGHRARVHPMPCERCLNAHTNLQDLLTELVGVLRGEDSIVELRSRPLDPTGRARAKEQA